MKKITAKKIMKKTQKNYEKIAVDFAKSRKFLWPEFNYFKGFVNEGDKILDLGCGGGRLVELFSDYQVIDYIGVDNCQGLINYAKQKYPKENFINSDILNLQFSPKTFNVVFSIAVLNHFPKPLQMLVLNNIRRVLKPGGYLLMTNWNLWVPSFKKKSVFKYNVKRLFTSKKTWYQRYGISKKVLSFKDILTVWRKNQKKGYLYYYAFSKRELKNLAHRAGFKVEAIFYSKAGQKVPWYKGGNIVMVCKKR